jgi:hypothetical protein
VRHAPIGIANRPGQRDDERQPVRQTIFEGEAMKRICIGGLALLAIAALNGLAILSASAAENTKILPEGTPASPLTATGTSGEAKFETSSGIELKCKAGAGSAEATSANAGFYHGEAKGCTSLLGSTCTGLGDDSGIILLLGTFHFWLYKKGTVLSAAGIDLLNPVHFECGGVLDVVEGCIAGAVTPLESLTTSLIGTLNESHAKNEITKVLPPESTKEITCELTVRTGEGEAGGLGEQGTGIGSEFKKAGSTVTVLLMN